MAATIAIVSALQAEQACLCRGLATATGGASRVESVVAGIGARQAVEAADRLIRAGAAGLVSWGYAGGLDPRLAGGSLLLPRRIRLASRESLTVDGDWHAYLSGALATDVQLFADELLQTDQMIVRAEDKRALFVRTGSAAVDMESGALAALAKELDVPFVAVRAVVDSSFLTVPRAATMATTESGETRLRALLGALLRNPGELSPVIRLARAARQADHALRCAAPHLIAGFDARMGG